MIRQKHLVANIQLTRNALGFLFAAAVVYGAGTVCVFGVASIS